MQKGAAFSPQSIAVLAARAGGQALLDRFHTPRDIRSKGFRDIVTDADIAAQEAIVTIIHEHFPDHELLSEEGAPSSASTNATHDCVWVIDPLDGTVNYSRCIPGFSVSVAMVRQGEPEVGVVFDPLHNLLFTAERGAGATLNGQPTHVSKRSPISHTVVGLDWARNQQVRQRIIASLGRVAPAVGTLRVVGSAALAMCYVAAGWLDAYFHLSLQPWDCAAVGLVIREAGGTLTDPSGADWAFTSPACLASNGLIHSDLLGLMDLA